MKMLIIVLAIAAAVGAYLLWRRKPVAVVASGASGDGPLASLEAYRQSRPSNFYLGKPTCSQCGSHFVDNGTCRNCGTTLFRG